MTSFAAARSLLRSAPASRSAAAGASRSPFRAASRTPLNQRTFRVPSAHSSFCVESMLPYHTATASALMTSMLSISQRSYAWLPDGRLKTR